MADRSIDLISAGHMCLDITPAFPSSAAGRSMEQLLRPGTLVVVDPPSISSGGGAANVGLSALRLGFSVALMGKCGDDLLGHALLDVLKRVSPACAAGMRMVAGEDTSTVSGVRTWDDTTGQLNAPRVASAIALD